MYRSDPREWDEYLAEMSIDMLARRFPQQNEKPSAHSNDVIFGGELSNYKFERADIDRGQPISGDAQAEEGTMDLSQE